MAYWGINLGGSKGPFDKPLKGSSEDTWNKLTSGGSTSTKKPSTSGSSSGGSSGGGAVSAPSYNPYAEMQAMLQAQYEAQRRAAEEAERRKREAAQAATIRMWPR